MSSVDDDRLEKKPEEEAGIKTDGSSLPAEVFHPVVARSDVPAGLPYLDYRPHLRLDFFWSCAYCTVSEAEAGGLRFTIDHYEPQVTRPDLTDQYYNLMWCCDTCNIRKGSRSPSDAARSKGIRFYRPDEDCFEQNFYLEGVRIKHLSEAGYFTIEAMDLNRYPMRRLRELRQRLTSTSEHVAQGIRGLRHWPLERLPPQYRRRASSAIMNAAAVADGLSKAIDSILESHARSIFLDEDLEKERLEERKSKLKELEILYPGAWQHQNAPRGKR